MVAKQLSAAYFLQLTPSPLSSPSSTRRGKPTSTHLGLSHLRSSRCRVRAFHSTNTPFSDDQSESFKPPSWLDVYPERPGWVMQLELASSPVPSPKKRQPKAWEDSVCRSDAGEDAVKRAFSSMVFIIREIHSYSLQLRELLFFEDLRGVLLRVQKEMHASFCWLFQQIFSCTPVLMLSLMLLLANFTVHSMSHTALAAPQTLPASVSFRQAPESTINPREIKPTSHVGGGGGGWKARPATGATDDGRRATAVPSVVEGLEEEAESWRRVVAEAAEMRHEAVRDREVRRAMVAPVTVEAETDKWYPEYFRTELLYRRALEQQPDDRLLLLNYAQFLFLVLHDHNRAEHYFKKVVSQQPADGEALGRYANFLWVAKNDLCMAEEMYLEAMAADPSNAAHAANYAHFLWSTGGEDTCFPLDDDA